MLQTDLRSMNDQMRKLVSFKLFTLILWMFLCLVYFCMLHHYLIHWWHMFPSVESEHGQQISDLKSSLSNLQSAQDLLKERVDSHDTLNTNVRTHVFSSFKFRGKIYLWLDCKLHLVINQFFLSFLLQLRAELSDWLIKHLKDPSSLESTIVLRPELQRALEDLEKRILEKLVHEKASSRDAWRTVGETLEQEGAGAATIQVSV